MKRTVILREPENYKSLLDALDSIPTDVLHEVEIREHKANLSASQRGLYFEWITIVSMSTGMTKDEAHLHYKREFLIRIFERDKEWYREIIESIRKVYSSGERSMAQTMYDNIIKLTSIRDANTKQMSEYMEDMRMDVQSKLSVQLPLPEDQVDSRKIKCK